MIVTFTLAQHVIYISSTNARQRPSWRKLIVLEFLPKTPLQSLYIVVFSRDTSKKIVQQNLAVETPVNLGR